MLERLYSVDWQYCGWGENVQMISVGADHRPRSWGYLMGALCMLVLYNTCQPCYQCLWAWKLRPHKVGIIRFWISKSTNCRVKISYMLEGFSIEREHSCLRIAKCYVCISLRINPPQTLQFAKSNPITKVCGSYAITLLIGSSLTLHEDLHDHSKR